MACGCAASQANLPKHVSSGSCVWNQFSVWRKKKWASFIGSNQQEGKDPSAAFPVFYQNIRHFSSLGDSHQTTSESWEAWWSGHPGSGGGVGPSPHPPWHFPRENSHQDGLGSTPSPNRAFGSPVQPCPEGKLITLLARASHADCVSKEMPSISRDGFPLWNKNFVTMQQAGMVFFLENTHSGSTSSTSPVSCVLIAAQPGVKPRPH